LGKELDVISESSASIFEGSVPSAAPRRIIIDLNHTKDVESQIKALIQIDALEAVTNFLTTSLKHYPPSNSPPISLKTQIAEEKSTLLRAF